MIKPIAALLLLAVASCDVYWPTERKTDAMAPTTCAVSEDRALGCWRACSATAERAVYAQLCPNEDYPSCELECQAGVAQRAWCP